MYLPMRNNITIIMFIQDCTNYVLSNNQIEHNSNKNTQLKTNMFQIVCALDKSLSSKYF